MLLEDWKILTVNQSDFGADFYIRTDMLEMLEVLLGGGNSSSSYVMADI